MDNFQGSMIHALTLSVPSQKYWLQKKFLPTFHVNPFHLVHLRNLY